MPRVQATFGACTPHATKVQLQHAASQKIKISNWNCRYGCCQKNRPEYCHRWLRNCACNHKCGRIHAVPPWMSDKTCQWWCKDHRPRSLTEGGSVGGSPSRGCNQQNLKRTLENASQDRGKRLKIRPALTVDELVSRAFEGAFLLPLLESEPEDSPVRELLTGDDEPVLVE